MAIYHFSAKIISRAAGSSALAAAAYRSASRLHDQRLGRHHDFSNKAGVVHSEVMLPDGAPERWRGREPLWNDVEAVEIRKDAQLAREIEFAIPRELDRSEGIRLARDFVAREFVARGMVADLNVHWDIGADGQPKPHAHVMLGLRAVHEDGFGAKVRDWNRTDLLEHWREAWAGHVNQRLVELDIGASVDHRTLEAQGIDLEPQHKIGPAACRMSAQGLARERVDDHREIARLNGERLLVQPAIALDAITHGQATFTTRDLAMFVHRHSDGKDQFEAVMAAIKAAPEIVTLGRDGRGEQRFTSRSMIETEQRLERATIQLDTRRHHGVERSHRDIAIARAGLELTLEQRSAFDHVTRASDLGVVIGYAGTGKSAMLGVARAAWEAAGYHVQGLALSGIAAENLENGSGIASRTIASIEHQWAQDRERLTDRHVVVIDEAGMIGTRQMERVIGEAQKRGAKVVLVGDPEQLQAIEAGGAFRSIAERHGGIEITAIRRQREDWQRDATRHLATGRADEALNAYEQAGHVHAAHARAQASAALIDRWDRDSDTYPDNSRIILTHANDVVHDLNLAAREKLRARGLLGDDITIAAERGERDFARGDRIMFLRNERSLGVKNGSLGTVEGLTSARMAVLLDDGRSIAFDIKEYAHVDHGYAATIHKAQGMTVDRVHVLATPGLDRHAAYVALSRHRDRVDLHYGHDDFADASKLARAFGRERGKDMAADYAMSGETTRATPPAPPRRDSFAGLRLKAAPAVTAPEPAPMDKAVQRYARAAADIVRMRSKGFEPLEHQRRALRAAAQGLDTLRPESARDLRTAFNATPALIGEAARGQSTGAIRAMVLEAEIRVSCSQRADRFVAEWQRQARQFHALDRDGQDRAAMRVREEMSAMAKSLERDPQLESLLRNRVIELGIRASGGASLSHDLQSWLGPSRSRGLGR